MRGVDVARLRTPKACIAFSCAQLAGVSPLMRRGKVRPKAAEAAQSVWNAILGERQVGVAQQRRGALDPPCPADNGGGAGQPPP